MIRKESFNVSREAFAAARKQVLTDAMEDLRPHVADAVRRVGLPGWESPVVSAALDLFDLTARAEVDELNPIIDDMRDLFAVELAETLAKTKTSSNVTAQIETLTGWITQMAHNAAIEAATTSDPDGDVGLEWVTMGDGAVRDSHQEANGQQVPTGSEFEVDGEKLLYPGQPVGDPSVWINCRCLARPTMLDGELAAATITASADKPFTSSVLVALPAADDPVNKVSSEADGAHCTLLFFGDSTAFDPAPILAVMQAVADGVTNPGGSVTEKIIGGAILGPDKAQVALLDAVNLANIRGAILGHDDVRAVHDGVPQFPAWIPHLTLGYPETPPLTDDYPDTEIRFDRLALWHGEERTEYPLGGGTMAEPTTTEETPALAAETAEFAFPPPGEPEDLPAEPAEPEEGRESDTPAKDEGLRPWHGVLAPEGSPSGDKRGFAERMLTMRDLPLPLKAMFTDDEGHKGSVVVGRIDEVYRDGGLIKAAGVWDISPEAEKAAGMIDRKMWRGVSVDLDAAEGEMIEAADGGQPSVEFTQGRVCSATLCAIPAFAEAFIRNGTWAEFANEPLPTGDMVEIPDWPAVSLVASAAPAISADYFRNPMLTELTPVTRGEDGHIFGHLGGWQTCHIAYEVCTTVPPSETDYAYFLTGQVFTDAGPVAVGQLTVGGGHADMKLGLRAAMAHYDNVASAVADITVGEDEFGVWFSGRIRPWATEKQIHEMFAAGPSGDWRGVRHAGRDSMEMIAAHCVNVQGFPVPRTRFAVENGRQTALVAAGAVPKKSDAVLSAEFRTQMQAYQAEQERMEQAAVLFTELRGMQFADVFNEISTMEGK